MYLELDMAEHAKRIFQEVVETRKRFNDPLVLRNIHYGGLPYYALGRYKECAEILEETFKLQKKLLGLEHIYTIESMSSLSTTYQSLGRQQEAGEFEEASKCIRRSRAEGGSSSDASGSIRD
jgi:tetratricopeptide (TPR) repeat protein